VRLGVDLDGVTIDSIPYWIRVFNRDAGTAFEPGDLPDPYSRPDWAAIADRHELEMLVAGPPMPGAREAFHALKVAGHELIVVTARHPRLRGITAAWLAHYDLPVDEMHFLEGGSKGEYSRNLGIRLFVEDAPHNARSLAAAGVGVLLFDHPYNREVSGEGVLRCRGWDEVVRAVIRTESGEVAV